jgi:hypothetical protein
MKLTEGQEKVLQENPELRKFRETIQHWYRVSRNPVADDTLLRVRNEFDQALKGMSDK